MANEREAEATWLPVIGKALAYLCLKQAEKQDAEKYKGVLAKVKFLTDLGLPIADAAEAAGSNAASVSALNRQQAGKPRKATKGGKNGSAKKRTK